MRLKIFFKSLKYKKLRKKIQEKYSTSKAEASDFDWSLFEVEILSLFENWKTTSLEDYVYQPYRSINYKRRPLKIQERELFKNQERK